MSALVKAVLLTCALWVSGLLAYLGLVVAGVLYAGKAHGRAETAVVAVIAATALTYAGGTGLVLRACKRLNVVGAARWMLISAYVGVAGATVLGLVFITAIVFDR